MKNLILFSSIFLLAPVLVSAQSQNIPLVGLPGLGTGTPDFDRYIETIYAITITVAALLAVIKIVIAGVKWMTTDIVTTKGDAKKDIQGAVVGLLVVLAAVLIIEVINPDINNVDLTLTRTTPPPAAPAAGLPMESYTPISGPGYTYISSDLSESSAGQQNQFQADCEAGGGTFRLDVGTSQLRCNEPVNAAFASEMNTLLTAGPNPLTADGAAARLEQFETYVVPYQITNSAELETIVDDIGATDVFFAATTFIPNPAFATGDSPLENIPMSQTERDQFYGICDAVARAQGLNVTNTGEYVVESRDNNTIACLRP